MADRNMGKVVADIVRTSGELANDPEAAPKILADKAGDAIETVAEDLDFGISM
jgi:hypothetical protein